MGKLYVFNMFSVDGYFAGLHGEIDWHNVGTEEFNDFATKQLEATKVLLFGRVTYELMASFWPTEKVIKDDPIVADLMNRVPKVVVAPKLPKPWQNTTLVNKDVAGAVTKLKKQTTGDIGIFGSSILSVSLLKLGLIDELRIIVNPIALGEGRSFFAGLNQRLPLKLIETKRFKSGNVLLVYAIPRT